MLTEKQKQDFLQQLKDLQTDEDPEIGHRIADGVLCEILIILGYEDIIEEYEKIDKWYS